MSGSADTNLDVSPNLPNFPNTQLAVPTDINPTYSSEDGRGNSLHQQQRSSSLQSQISSTISSLPPHLIPSLPCLSSNSSHHGRPPAVRPPTISASNQTFIVRPPGAKTNLVLGRPSSSTAADSDKLPVVDEIRTMDIRTSSSLLAVKSSVSSSTSELAAKSSGLAVKSSGLAPIKLTLTPTNTQKSQCPSKRPISSCSSHGVIQAFTAEEDDSDGEEMPPEAKMKMRNIGKNTPTACGPNSFSKGKLGFCNRQKQMEYDLELSLVATLKK